MNNKITAFFIISLFFFLLSIKSVSAQCYSITNSSNTLNPSFTHTFTITPNVPGTNIVNTHVIRLRVFSLGAWKLTASRIAITRTSGSGASSDDIKDTDIGWTASIRPVSVLFGSASLVAPFSGSTTLNSISTAGGTQIVSGTGSTAFASCTPSTRFYELTVNLSVPQDFIFNSGTYTGMITYTLGP